MSPAEHSATNVAPPGDTAIGIDVGGTAIRAGRVTPDGRILARRAHSTPPTLPGLMRWIADSIHELTETTSPDGAPAPTTRPAPVVAVALPGILNEAGTALLRCVNLPYLENVPLTDALKATCSEEVYLLTDADAATWGEYSVLHPPPPRFAHLRLGTGVALGVVAEGRCLRLPRDGLHHLDLLVVDDGPGARLCRCGRRGCLEAYVGRRREDSVLADMPPAEALRRCVARLRDRLGAETVICLGGGGLNAVTHSADTRAARPEIRDRGSGIGDQGSETGDRSPASGDRPPVEVTGAQGCDPLDLPGVIRAQLGDDAGLIGAGLRARATRC